MRDINDSKLQLHLFEKKTSKIVHLVACWVRYVCEKIHDHSRCLPFLKKIVIKKGYGENHIQRPFYDSM